MISWEGREAAASLNRGINGCMAGCWLNEWMDGWMVREMKSLEVKRDIKR